MILQLSHVTKRFPGVVALDDMSLSVRRGTVHALVGENGAGKSTLMKILVGVYRMDEGEIIFDGSKLDNANINSVLKSGISMIYQELNPIDTVTVAENVCCGSIPQKIRGGLLIDRKKMNAEVQSVLDRLGITNIKPNSLVKHLSMAQKQLVEIAKALSHNSKLIVMDEPTSSLTEVECQKLFTIIRDLKASGISFIYISHKMDEIFDICDDITIMRDGKFVSTGRVEDMSYDQIISQMVGRTLTDIYPKEEVPIGDTVLDVSHLWSRDKVKDVSFTLRKGEILGFAGLVGAGRTETMETLFGCRPITDGTVSINGEPVQIHTSQDAIRHGMALLTEDRRNTGCILGADIYLNTMVLSFKRFANFLGIKHRQCRAVCREQIQKFGVKTVGLRQKMGELSGGNQQKVLLARWLLPDPDIIILDEPTRGIDVGSKHEIYREMTQLVKSGRSIIMVSSELPEILGMSDRIVVMHEGKIVGILNRKDANQEEIMRLASGIPSGKEVV